MAGRPPLEIGTHGDGSKPRQLPSGSWQTKAYYRDSDGVSRPVTATGKTPAQAKAALKAKLRDRKERQTGNGDLTRDSEFGALLDRWLETLETRRRPEDAEERVKGLLDGETIEKYREAVEKFVRPGLGAVRMRELNTQRMDGFLSNNPARDKHVRTVCSQACGLAVRWGLLEYNPTREVAKPVPKASDKRVLAPEDVQEVVRRTIEWQKRKPGQGGPSRGTDMTTIVTMLLATGERTGEVLAIRWCDIEHLDDTTRRVEVTISGTVTKKGTRKPIPKSDAGHRILTLPEWARAELLSQRARGLPFDLVFPTRNGTPRQVSQINRHFREIRGEEFDWVTPRTFRKTNSTTIERTHGAEAASKQLGHSSPDVTRKHYIQRARAAGDYTDALDALDPFTANNRSITPHLRVVKDE